MKEDVDFSSIVGQVFVDIRGLSSESAEVKFICADGTVYEMYHEQDCCEYVSIEDVCGSVQDLIGEPIVFADESRSDCTTSAESGTWTFYKLATRKGWVDIRWLGESNGYYSESVSFYRVTPESSQD